MGKRNPRWKRTTSTGLHGFKPICGSRALHDQWNCSDNSMKYGARPNYATTRKLLVLANNKNSSVKNFCQDCINKVSQLYPEITRVKPKKPTEGKTYKLRIAPSRSSGRVDKKLKYASYVSLGAYKADWNSIKEQRACISDETVAGYLVHCYERYGHLLKNHSLETLDHEPITYSLVDIGDWATYKWNIFKEKYNMKSDGELITLLMDDKSSLLDLGNQTTVKRWNDLKAVYDLEDDGDLATLLMDKAFGKEKKDQACQTENDEVQPDSQDKVITHTHKTSIKKKKTSKRYKYKGISRRRKPRVDRETTSQTNCDEAQHESEDKGISHGSISGDDMDITSAQDMDINPAPSPSDVTQPHNDSLESTAHGCSSESKVKSKHIGCVLSTSDAMSKNNIPTPSQPTKIKLEPDDAEDLVMDCCTVNEDYHSLGYQNDSESTVVKWS